MTAFSMTGTLKEPAQRIVSLAPSLTETLFFLGLEPSIAGITEQCDVPQEVAQKEKIGTFSQPDLKRIGEVRADIVLGLERIHGRFADHFASAGISTIVFNYQTVEDIFTSMEEIARIAGAQEQGTELIGKLRDRVSRVRATTNQSNTPRVFRLMTDDPIVTPTATCYQSDAMRLAGAQPLELDFEEPYSSVTMEQIIKFDPQVIISCGRQTAKEARKRCQGCRAATPSCMRLVEKLASQDGWSQTSAARESRVHALSCGMLCRPGPQIADGIERLAELFHGDQRAMESENDRQD